MNKSEYQKVKNYARDNEMRTRRVGKTKGGENIYVFTSICKMYFLSSPMTCAEIVERLDRGETFRPRIFQPSIEMGRMRAHSA